MSIVDITELTSTLLTLSAVTTVVVEMVKTKKPDMPSNMKYILAIIASLALAFSTDVSIFETKNVAVHYVGVAFAGLVTALGSNFIHEAMKVLQTIKTLRK